MVAGSFFLSVHVDQAHIGKGIGSRLASEGERFAKANGCERLTAFVTEADAHGRAFAEKRGYALGRHLFESVMSTDRWTEDEIDRHVRAAQTSGVRFTTLADVGYTEESKRLFFELSDECDLDEPGTVEFGAQTFEDYERNVFGAPWFQPDGVFLAIADGRWAGIHTIGELKDSDIADFTVDFTGVRRPFRGRGVATALKMLGVRYAKSKGGTKIMTHNDSRNGPMLAVNTRLGYEPRPGLLLMNKILTPDS